MATIERQQVLSFMPQPKRWHNVVSWLLWLANSDAPKWNRRLDFYSLKDMILSRWGIDDGCDWQRITKYCWGCGGSGYFTHWMSGDKDICNRCYGSGVYEFYYVKLHRLTFGGRVFHKPGETQNNEPDSKREIIAGRIKHQNQGWKAVAAFIVLLMIFDKRRLWKLVRRDCSERYRRVVRRITRWFPCRCKHCRCFLFHKDVACVSNGRELCHKCYSDEEIPF